MQYLPKNLRAKLQYNKTKELESEFVLLSTYMLLTRHSCLLEAYVLRVMEMDA